MTRRTMTTLRGRRVRARMTTRRRGSNKKRHQWGRQQAGARTAAAAAAACPKHPRTVRSGTQAARLPRAAGPTA